MGDWSNNLEYEQREYYGHFYDTDEDVHEEENDRPCDSCEHHKENGCEKWSCVFDRQKGGE